jgi:hypothetical protein
VRDDRAGEGGPRHELGVATGIVTGDPRLAGELGDRHDGCPGTYTVDADGVFRDEQLLRSSFANWNGKRRDTGSLTETVDGDVMTEHLDDGEGVQVTIGFSRAQLPA